MHIDLDNTLNIYVITHDTKDLGSLFVVRKHVVIAMVSMPTTEFQTASTLEEVRKFIPSGLTRIPRDDFDDPVIVESWI